MYALCGEYAQTSCEGTQSSDEGCEGGSESREEGYRITNPTLPMLALCVVIGIVIAVILVAGINSVQNKNDAGNSLWLKRKRKRVMLS